MKEEDMPAYLVQMQLDNEDYGRFSEGELIQAKSDKDAERWARKAFADRLKLKQGDRGFRVLRLIHRQKDGQAIVV